MAPKPLPPGMRRKSVTVRMKPSTIKKLEELAAAYEINKTDVLHKLIDEAHNKLTK